MKNLRNLSSGRFGSTVARGGGNLRVEEFRKPVGKPEEAAQDGAAAADGVADREYDGGDDLNRISFKWESSPDHAAAAADRVIFPNRKGNAGGEFDGVISHPLGSGFKKLSKMNAEEAHGCLQDSFGGIKADSWRDFFFLLWRRWREETAKLNGDLAYYPADTRLPDHSCWNHMQLTAAFEACREGEGAPIRPAFLLFQLGAVQEFIAAARSVRDLWSGSYLVSWLTAHAIKAVTDEVGPSAVISPALCGLGIFDAVNRELFERISYKGRKGKEDTLWRRIYDDNGEKGTRDAAGSLLDPTIPNRFLAIVPAGRAEELARSAEQAVRDELKRIGDRCFSDLNGLSERDVSRWRSRWDRQIELIPQITYQTLPFHGDIDKVLMTLEAINPGQARSMRETIEWAETKIPEEHRDGRNYRKCPHCGNELDRCSHPGKIWKLNRPEFAYGANYAEANWRLAARRNTHDFAPFVTDENQHGSPKDALTGREEVIGDKDFWDQFKNPDNSGGKESRQSAIFKGNEGPYGAATIVKRLWCRTDGASYLSEALGMPSKRIGDLLRFESTHDLAGGDGYIAILAMDGDEMGKWVSGDNAPFLKSQLAPRTWEYFEAHGVSEELRRQVTPSYHLQFSEALTNFASKFAGKIVSAHYGSLIYAGGDDVMAMLPAKEVIGCAEELCAAFHGEQGWHDGVLVPGCKVRVSCGIAVAHEKYPLQRAVEEARRAEQRAKREYCRDAFAVSLLKRGGEIIHWGGHWNDCALPLYRFYCECADASPKVVSGRFPYVLAGLLAPYRLERGEDSFAPGFNPQEIIERELEQVLSGQVESGELRHELREKCHAYLGELEKSKRWDDFARLFLTAAFIRRDRSGDNEGEPQE